MAAGGGDLVADFEYPEPDPAPVTTIAWRIAHIRVGVFGQRNASHFGRRPDRLPERRVGRRCGHRAGRARRGVRRLDEGGRRARLDDLTRPVGPAEGPFAEHPYAELVLHINREVIHHGAEILLLRDLYRAGH